MTNIYYVRLAAAACRDTRIFFKCIDILYIRRRIFETLNSPPFSLLHNYSNEGSSGKKERARKDRQGQKFNANKGTPQST